MLGLSVIILFKSLLHVFCSLFFSAHNTCATHIPHICHFFTRTHFKSWKFYTRKVRKLRQNCQKQYFSGSSGFFYTQTNFLHAQRSHCVTRSSFNPWCNVPRILFLKTSYVSLMYKSRIVLKIFSDPFLSFTLPQRGKISNIRKSQTKHV